MIQFPHTFPWTHKKQSDLAPWWNRHPEPAPNPDWMRRRSGWHPSQSRECGPEHSPGCDRLAAVSAGRGGAGCRTDRLWCAPPCREKVQKIKIIFGKLFFFFLFYSWSNTEFIFRRIKWMKNWLVQEGLKSFPSPFQKVLIAKGEEGFSWKVWNWPGRMETYKILWLWPNLPLIVFSQYIKNAFNIPHCHKSDMLQNLCF